MTVKYKTENCLRRLPHAPEECYQALALTSVISVLMVLFLECHLKKVITLQMCVFYFFLI